MKTLRTKQLARFPRQKNRVKYFTEHERRIEKEEFCLQDWIDYFRKKRQSDPYDRTTRPYIHIKDRATEQALDVRLIPRTGDAIHVLWVEEHAEHWTLLLGVYWRSA